MAAHLTRLAGGGRCLSGWEVCGMKRVEEAFGGCGRGAQWSGAELLPLVYEDLLRLATRQLAKGSACGAFEPAELVHEAWLRLVGGHDRGWSHRGHFFAAAVETMRRILVEHARRAGRRKRGGGSQWVDLERVQLPAPVPEEPLLALEEALGQLAGLDFPAAELVRLRFFVGLTQSAAAQQLGLSRSGADRAWFFARAWLLNQLRPVTSAPRTVIRFPQELSKGGDFAAAELVEDS